MDLSNLKPKEGSVHKKKRIGRGQGTGKGGTSTRGHKGAQSRSGYSRKFGFEGGQMPLQRRIPKRGFKNINRVEYTALNLDKLQKWITKYGWKEVTVEAIRNEKLIQKTELVKLLGRGELTSKINVEVHAASNSAKEAIEKLGGSLTIAN